MPKRKKGNPKLWSVPRIRDPRHPEILLRITELARGGPLYVARMKDGKQKMVQLAPKVTRVSLGETTSEQEDRARALALDLIEELANPEEAPAPEPEPNTLTLTQLAGKYDEKGFHGRGDGYRKQQVASIRRIATYLGDKLVMTLKPSDVADYREHRLRDGVTAAARGDLVALSIGINWAVGEELLETNPLASKAARNAMQVDHQPLRPVAKKDRYEKLRAVAPEIHPAFAVLLDLAWHTGHRISAILGLRWRDVTFEIADTAPHGAIKWYEGVRRDKKKHEHLLPMNAAAHAALLSWREQSPGIASAFIFPNQSDATKALDPKSEPKRWLRQAETRAKLSHVKQGAWHMFRRGWATERKHLPLKDVADGGGWLDTATVAKCYQHADEETTRAVVTYVA